MTEKDLIAIAIKAGFTIDENVAVNRIRKSTLIKFIKLLTAAEANERKQ